MTFDARELTTDVTTRRVRVVTNVRFEVFVAAFEHEVPALSHEDALSRLSEDGDWSAFVRGLEWEAPSGFVRMSSWRPSELLHHAGNPTPAVIWSIVHHAVGARLFRHDPATLLHLPLRIEAHADGPGTVLNFDVPGDPLRSFPLNKVVQAGAELDRALGDLLEDLGVPRPAALRR